MNEITVGTFIPSDVSRKELDLITEKLDMLLKKTNLHMSFYRTSDIDLLQYFLNLKDDRLKKITIHTMSSSSLLDDEVESTIDLLRSKGLLLKEHLFPVNSNGETSEEYYRIFIHEMLDNCDEVISFKSSDHKQFTKVLRPLDLAKERGRKVYVVELERDGKIIKE